MAIFETIIEYLGSIRPLLANLGMSGIGPGWLFGIFGAITISMYGLSVGKTRAILSLFSIYVAFAFDRLFPYFDSIESMVGGSTQAYWIRLVLFIMAYFLVFLLFSFSFLRKRISAAEFSLFSVILISFFQLGFFISILFSIIPEQKAIDWSFGFYYLFSNQAMFFWAMIPMPVLLLLKK